ncbi:lantibiotic dehydratase [Micromonospora sp. NPDC048830]|uniref:lantibiotic dehydratase n=1 Tax=Micromonospora sp. NPDC048830 TaxID=3364257 RepID=UPI003712E83D
MTTDSVAATAPGDGAFRATEATWHLMPVVVLRQAGFPMELLEPLVAPEAGAEADDLLARRAALIARADEARGLLRSHRVAGRQRVSSRIGQLRPIPADDYAAVAAELPESAASVLRAYQEGAAALTRAWSAFGERHRQRLEAAGLAVVAAFADPALREVLLLSNDAAYPGFAAWLDSFRAGPEAFRGEVGRRTRKMTDLLTMYLQRVTTKNETNSHFGPFTVGRVGAAPGITFAAGGSLRRHACFAHWAAERLAMAAGEIPELAGYVRPRRRPLAFLRDGRLDLYAFTTRDGLDTEWHFRHVARTDVSPAEERLWRRCDGERTLRELRAEWQEYGAGNGRSFDEVLSALVRDEQLIAELEVPAGDSRPLAALRELLPADDEHARPVLDEVAAFERDLVRFAAAPPAARPGLLAEAKARFERLTGGPANRNSGLHYADRAILFEEAHSPLRELTIGPDVARFVADELSIVYEVVLAGPRLRMRREMRVLTRWLTERFGPGVEVPLDLLYAEFIADRDRLAAECAPIDAELAALDEAIMSTLLGADTDRSEVVVDRARMAEVLKECVAHPSAVCNPDVLFAAPSREALAAGDFTAVIGDCHAVREVITHTSFGPLVQERAPDLLPEVYQGYLSLLDEDEVLVNLTRGHPDKSSTQLCYPCLDLEVYGRSRQRRDQVIQPSQLYVTVRDGRAELRAYGVTGRIRLMAPPAGGPSIRQDPLSPFSFPRHFGGVGLQTAVLAHVPRIRCGRVVLQRETWRVPADRLRGLAYSGDRVAADDAAEFLAARRLRAEHGLPRHVFVKLPGEPKPIYVDWEAPLLVRQLCRLARRARGTVEISEMLPGPDQRWFAVDGQRYTTELRCAVFSPGRPG